MRRKGIIYVTGELLAQALGFPEGTCVTHVLTDKERIDSDDLCLRLEGPTMPEVAEGDRLPVVDIPEPSLIDHIFRPRFTRPKPVRFDSFTIDSGVGL